MNYAHTMISHQAGAEREKIISKQKTMNKEILGETTPMYTNENLTPMIYDQDSKSNSFFMMLGMRDLYESRLSVLKKELEEAKELLREVQIVSMDANTTRSIDNFLNKTTLL